MIITFLLTLAFILGPTVVWATASYLIHTHYRSRRQSIPTTAPAKSVDWGRVAELEKDIFGEVKSEQARAGKPYLDVGKILSTDDYAAMRRKWRDRNKITQAVNAMIVLPEEDVCKLLKATDSFGRPLLERFTPGNNRFGRLFGCDCVRCSGGAGGGGSATNGGNSTFYNATGCSHASSLQKSAPESESIVSDISRGIGSVNEVRAEWHSPWAECEDDSSRAPKDDTNYGTRHDAQKILVDHVLRDERARVWRMMESIIKKTNNGEQLTAADRSSFDNADALLVDLDNRIQKLFLPGAVSNLARVCQTCSTCRRAGEVISNKIASGVYRLNLVFTCSTCRHVHEIRR